jgi:hypothetical protein
MSSSNVMPVHNLKALFSVLVGVTALGILLAGGAAARFVENVSLGQAVLVVPAGFVLALVALSLARRGRFDYQRTLGRIGGERTAKLGKFFGMVALLGSLTAGLALGVYLVLDLVLA